MDMWSRLRPAEYKIMTNLPSWAVVWMLSNTTRERRLHIQDYTPASCVYLSPQAVQVCPLLLKTLQREEHHLIYEAPHHAQPFIIICSKTQNLKRVLQPTLAQLFQVLHADMDVSCISCVLSEVYKVVILDGFFHTHDIDLFPSITTLFTVNWGNRTPPCMFKPDQRRRDHTIHTWLSLRSSVIQPFRI